MAGQMSEAEEKILTVSKEELFELCHRFSEGKTSEEDGFFCDNLEELIPKRSDITLVDLCLIYKMMVEEAPSDFCIVLERWSEDVIPERFAELSISEQLDFLEKLADQSRSAFVICELLQYHLQLPEGSATACIIENIMEIVHGNGLGSGSSGLNEEKFLKSLVKLIRLELGVK